MTPSGKLKWVSGTGRPERHENGDIVWDSIVLDITEKKFSELNLREALDQLTKLKNKFQSENVHLKKEIDLAYNYKDMIYASSEISEVLNEVDMVAATNATVLLQGETGTGKEIIARAIHYNSHRKSRPLIKVNCATIPKELIESELFGHKKGAFTGAIEDRIGKFQLAHGGTLFLDEIGELPIDMQPKLLRVLQEAEIEAIGSSKTVKLDVRIIAATNRNLLEEIEKGNFREDLFFRLNVFPVVIPPLRDRKDDIPVLINHFVAKFSKKYRKKLKTISKEHLESLMGYDWPGNVRELENLIERAVIISKDERLTSNLGFSDKNSEHERSLNNIGKTLNDVQREHIIKTLKSVEWKISGKDGAAAILDVKPSTLRDRMAKLGIQKP
jgi:transcriptional regulator with GAF, ATPase, and Fis domain